MKGRSFDGIYGGANYKFWARMFGMGEKFYNAGVKGIKLEAGMKALDMGCGPGALSFALAQKASPDALIMGIDISDDQLNYASRHSKQFRCLLEFKKMSMDELDFADNSLDLVVTSMALHETPPQVRRDAIKQVARVLKPGGKFVLTDWSRPKLGLLGIIWFPAVCCGENNKDNWNNVYSQLCRQQGLVLREDVYINSIVRRQIFEKPGIHEKAC